MFSGMRYAVIGIAIVVTAALTACGSSGSTEPSGNTGGSSGPQGSTGPSSSGLAGAPCNSIAPMAGWSGIYTACVNSSGTFTELTNQSQWDVLILEVPSGDAVPQMSLSLPQGSSLADLVEQTEFAQSIGSDFALVPPGATLSSTSSGGAPVYLDVGIDFSVTAESVTAMGLVDVVEDKVNPVQSEAEAIVTCANYVRSLPAQINQSQPSSPTFWNTFASAAQCSDAFSSASDALETGESAVIEDAEDATSDFFDDILPKLADLIGELLFH